MLHDGGVGRWVHEPDLTEGESITLAQAANRQVGWRALGGRLFVTNRRLVFEPNVVDRNSGGKRWECRLETVRAVEVDRRSATFWGPLAKVRPRVFVSTDSAEEAFLVKRAREVGRAISAAVDAARA
jgi:hypothetical protein